MAVRFLLRRDTAANWTSVNPTLQSGELAIETDTGRTKNGDGATAWVSLPYASVPPSVFIQSLLNDSNAAAARATLELGSVSTLDSDNDASLAANSATRVATQMAVKAYVDAAVTGLLDYKGNVACAANPNYPAALKGDSYVVSSAGKIGGASGINVDVGDAIVASADNAGGTQASVGTSWSVFEHNLEGALLTTNNLSDVASVPSARSNLGLTIGTHVQAWDADLDAIAALATATYGRALLTLVDAAAAQTALGLAAVAASGSFADLSNKPGIRSNGQNVISASKTLNDADKGTHILLLPGVGTITFPTGWASGEGVILVNLTGGNVTLAAQFASDFGSTLPNNASFIAISHSDGFWRQFCYSTSRL